MVRPAMIFIFFAIFIVEFVGLFSHKNLKLFIKESFLKLFPFVIGIFLSFFIQYLYSSKWTKFFEAQKYWNIGLHPLTTISDWSVEGFALNTFSIFFICLPALAFIIYTLLKDNRLNNYKSISLKENKHFKYFILVSNYYFVSVFIFTLLTSGGSLHSLFRFIMVSPPFFITLLILLNNLHINKLKFKILCISIPIILITLFLTITTYGGNRFDFSFSGLYLSIAIISFLLFRNNLKFSLQIIIATFIILCSIIWNTYMLNIFFSSGWIFT